MKIIKAKVTPYVPLTEADVDKAIARGRRLKRLYANASNVRYENDCLSIGFSDGSRVVLPVAGLPEFEGFSEKDFQQLAIIKYFTQKLGYPLEIIPCPIFREEDGLAMSSRNRLLNPEQRKAAPAIYKALSDAARLAGQRELTPVELIDITIKEINNTPQLNTEYVEIVNSLTLQPVTRWEEAVEVQMWVAVFAVEIRLIDNIKLK